MEEIQELINKIREIKVKLAIKYPEIRDLIITEMEDAIKELQDVLEILNNYAPTLDTSQN